MKQHQRAASAPVAAGRRHKRRRHHHHRGGIIIIIIKDVRLMSLCLSVSLSVWRHRQQQQQYHFGGIIDKGHHHCCGLKAVTPVHPASSHWGALAANGCHSRAPKFGALLWQGHILVQWVSCGAHAHVLTVAALGEALTGLTTSGTAESWLMSLSRLLLRP